MKYPRGGQMPSPSEQFNNLKAENARLKERLEILAADYADAVAGETEMDELVRLRAENARLEAELEKSQSAQQGTRTEYRGYVERTLILGKLLSVVHQDITEYGPNGEEPPPSYSTVHGLAKSIEDAISVTYLIQAERDELRKVVEKIKITCNVANKQKE